MSLSALASALVAAMVGFGGTLAIIVAAARNLGADTAEVSSWIVALCAGIGVFSIVLSVRHRMPVVGAWSLAGAVLLAGLPAGTGMAAGIGAFLVLGALMLVAGAVPVLGRLVAGLPASIGAAMLAGLVLRFVVGLFVAAQAAPAMVLPLLGVFVVARTVHAASAPLAVLLAGLPLAGALGYPLPAPVFGMTGLLWTSPAFTPESVLGLGVPLFLVTMATQQVAGAAVLRVAGYEPPVRSIWVASGVITLLLAPFGGYSINVASLTAAICTGPDTHRDPGLRWHAGWMYGATYLMLAAGGAGFAAMLAGLPAVLVATVAGTALLGPMTNALASAMRAEGERFAATVAFGVTASGYTAWGLSGAFWGLGAGVGVLGMERVAARVRRSFRRIPVQGA